MQRGPYNKTTILVRLDKRTSDEVMKAYDYKCQDCGDLAEEIHHKDGDRTNNRRSNLEPLCIRCHGKKKVGTSYKMKMSKEAVWV